MIILAPEKKPFHHHHNDDKDDDDLITLYTIHYTGQYCLSTYLFIYLRTYLPEFMTIFFTQQYKVTVDSIAMLWLWLTQGNRGPHRPQTWLIIVWRRTRPDKDKAHKSDQRPFPPQTQSTSRHRHHIIVWRRFIRFIYSNIRVSSDSNIRLYCIRIIFRCASIFESM